jgi:acetolactate synthase small subunit
MAASNPSQTIQILLENKPGALLRAVGIITAMGANIESLSVFPDAADSSRSRLTIVAGLTSRQTDLALRKLNSLVQVFEAHPLEALAVAPCGLCWDYHGSNEELTQ